MLDRLFRTRQAQTRVRRIVSFTIHLPRIRSIFYHASLGSSITFTYTRNYTFGRAIFALFINVAEERRKALLENYWRITVFHIHRICIWKCSRDVQRIDRSFSIGSSMVYIIDFRQTSLTLFTWQSTEILLLPKKWGEILLLYVLSTRFGPESNYLATPSSSSSLSNDSDIDCKLCKVCEFH